MQRLEDLLLQQAAAGEAEVSVLPAPVETVAPRGSSPVLDTSQTTLTVALREEVLAAPPAQDNPNTDPAAISWNRFKELLLEHYFLVRVKRKMEQDLREMRQGDRTVAEYEREFSRLLHYAPFVVRDDEDKARIFERGLQPSIFQLVQPSNLRTYQDVVNRALIVESCAADLQERREGLNKGKGKRPVAEGASQTHSGRPPRHSRNRSQSRGRDASAQRGGSERRQTRSCVICGGRHYPRQCSQRQGRCY
uniref:Retrotransposon gag domain-containing protein n=1 Tax=Ananas comosus var. bracteatus TaxID=296719 RepID=A0A6V7NY63_ANACO|nr:unnamed protein product [Ananas comosus var. bracteatus]